MIVRAVIASAITVAMIALAAFGVMSMLNAALLATFAMLLTGCLTIQRAWQSLEWKALVVLGAAVGLESAVTGSGLAKAAADLFATIGGDSPSIALAAVFVGTVLLTNIISNVASAVLMFSVAVSLAANLKVRLGAHQGASAAAEFRRILDHPGLFRNELIGALAHLGLARAYALDQETEKARTEYQDFLTLWKDADSDIPILKQARAEYAQLGF